MARAIPPRVTLLLFLLFFLGFAVTVLAFVDLRWAHWLLTAEVTTTSATHKGWELS